MLDSETHDGPGGPEATEWQVAAGLHAFHELVVARRRHTRRALAMFLVCFVVLVVSCGFLRGLTAAPLYRGLTVGYTILMVILVGMVLLTWQYQRWIERYVDPLAEQVRDNVATEGRS